MWKIIFRLKFWILTKINWSESWHVSWVAINKKDGGVCAYADGTYTISPVFCDSSMNALREKLAKNIGPINGRNIKPNEIYIVSLTRLRKING